MLLQLFQITQDWSYMRFKLAKSLIVINLLAITFSVQAASPLSLKNTIPFAKAVCKSGDSKLELYLNFDKKIPAEENDYTGANLLFLKAHKVHNIEVQMKPYPGDFSFVKKTDTTSICDKTLAFDLSNKVWAILYTKDHRPFQELYQMVVFDLAHEKVLLKNNLGAVQAIEKYKDGFLYSVMIPRSDVSEKEMQLPSGRKVHARDMDLKAIHIMQFSKNQAKLSVDPDVSYDRSEWKKYFKDKADYLKAADWDAGKNKFKKEIVYEAKYYNRDESDIKESCIVLVANRNTKVTESEWRCLKEKI